MPMSEPLLHSLTAAKLQAYTEQPSHALLLAGSAGMGKGTVARWLAANILAVSPDKLQTYPYFLEIGSQDGKAISIDIVRQLEHLLSLKIPNNKQVNRLIIISDAHLLTTEAQNALLKTLEEPPLGTVLLLTSSQQEDLLPTIRSRAQTIEVIKPLSTELETRLRDTGVASGKLPQIMALSGGLPGLAFALAQDDHDHPLVQAAGTARQLLQLSAFDKLCLVDTLSKNREASRNVVQILMQMAHATLLTGKSSQRWHRVLQAAYDADAALNKGTQPKLVLTSLMLNL